MYISIDKVLTRTGNRHQNLPGKPNLRHLTTERPRSSDSNNETSQREAFPILDDHQPSSPRANALRYRRDMEAGGFDQGRESTPTPSQYTSRYLAGPRPLSRHDGSPREWTKSPTTMQSADQRLPSGSFSEAFNRHKVQQDQSYEQDVAMLDTNNAGGHDPDDDSVGSATAPSTVWDELDDLKSRIRNLERTGKLPSTSAAAMANQSGERPRTATTAPTTISSSPQRVRKNSVAASEITVGGLAAANIHPLLHSALAKARPLLSPALYRAVEATAADALALAAMTGSTGAQGTQYSTASVANGVNVSDRQIRRKAESMCRNVTDLCIALCEGKSSFASPIVRHSPASMYRFQAETPPSRYARREGNYDPEIVRASPGRTLSRLEGRRGSLLGLGLSNNASSPRDGPEQYPYQDPSPNHVDYASRYNRPESSLLRARYSNLDDRAYDPSIRAPSRAMTEAGYSGQRRNEYGNGIQPRSPGLREVLASRRNSGIHEDIAEEQDLSPESARDRYRGVSERYRVPASEVGSLSSNKRRRRITSLEQYASPSPGIVDEPLRTASVSRRRNVLA